MARHDFGVRPGVHARIGGRSRRGWAIQRSGGMDVLDAARRLPCCSLRRRVARRHGARIRARSDRLESRCWRSTFAGGGHNDAWVGALVLAALALSVGVAAARKARSGSSRSRSSGSRSCSSCSSCFRSGTSRKPPLGVGGWRRGTWWWRASQPGGTARRGSGRSAPRVDNATRRTSYALPVEASRPRAIEVGRGGPCARGAPSAPASCFARRALSPDTPDTPWPPV